jgi:Transcriptional regulators
MNQYIPMLNYLNTHSIDDSYSKIIVFLLENRLKLSTISIQEISESCFVSNATISRFSKHFGFENFSNLKNYIFHKSDFSPGYTFRLSQQNFSLLDSNPHKFLTRYKEVIVESLDDVVNYLDIKKIDAFLQIVHQIKNVYIFSSDSSFNLSKELQGGFFLSGKLTIASDSPEDITRMTKELDNQTLVIIISSFGNFLSEHTEAVNNILKSPCQSYFLTQHTENMVSSSFTDTISVTSHNHVKAGSYPMAIFCEFLVRRYHSLYNNIC